MNNTLNANWIYTSVLEPQSNFRLFCPGDIFGSVCLRWLSHLSAAAYSSPCKPQWTLKAPLSPNPHCRQVKERWEILFSPSPTHCSKTEARHRTDWLQQHETSERQRSDRPRVVRQNKENKKTEIATLKKKTLEVILKEKREREQMECFFPPFPRCLHQG